MRHRWIPSATMRAFVRSVLFGAIAGAAPFLLMSTMLVLIGLPRALTDGREFAAMLMLWTAPLAVALPIVTCGSIFIGLPVAAMLRRRGAENAISYGSIGAASGGVLTAALVFVLEVFDGYWLTLLGAIAGAVTALTWWRSRSRYGDASGKRLSKH